MSTGKQLRMGRILGEDGRALVVAMDQGAVAGSMAYLEEPLRAIRAVAEGSPDSLVLTRGMLKHGWEAIPPRVGMVMRISGGFTVLEGAREFRDRVITGVEEALRWGADGVVAAVKFGHELEGEFIQAVSAVADACDRWGMPLLIEAMVALRGSAGLSEEEALAVAARAAAELGADLVQLRYPAKGGSLVEAIRGCPVPVLVQCGDAVDEDAVLGTVKSAVEDGAAGVALGRNAWQRDDPAPFMRRVHAALGR
ncbi:MAG: hypothetical protein H5T73_07625 [Actinobacteria bacterium]|nr:hypothetical protein [Actinomycetota bacterium]